jgi:hypothetical protein
MMDQARRLVDLLEKRFPEIKNKAPGLEQRRCGNAGKDGTFF